MDNDTAAFVLDHVERLQNQLALQGQLNLLIRQHLTALDAQIVMLAEAVGFKLDGPRLADLPDPDDTTEDTTEDTTDV